MKDYKYPRTPHLPYSLGTTNDDKKLDDTSQFNNMRLMASLKMDGENTTMTSDKVYARSINSVDHDSRHIVKSLWSTIRYEIPNGWRICGENLYAKHSIKYTDLVDYFQVFSIWNEHNTCLNWNETITLCSMLNLTPVSVIEYDFSINDLLDVHYKYNTKFNTHEGYVIRNIESFNYNDFYFNVAKYVRQNHVTTDSHWMYNKIEKNELKYKK